MNTSFSCKKPLRHSHFFSSSLPSGSAGVTSMRSARSFVHCSSVIGLSEITYLPRLWSICQASRHFAGSRFLSQKSLPGF